jgi:hypothetical protein
MLSNFIELMMITDDTKEDIVTIQIMMVSAAVGVESIGSVHCMEYDTMTDEVFKAKQAK